MVTVVYKKKRRVLTLNEIQNKDERVNIELPFSDVDTSLNKIMSSVEADKEKAILIQSSPEDVKKLRAHKFKCAKAWIRQNWPDLFGKDQKEDPKLLAVGIHKGIYQKYSECGGSEILGFSSKTIHIFIQRWVANIPYLKKSVEHAIRYDLDSKPIQVVTKKQAIHAQLVLNRRLKSEMVSNG